MLRCRVGAGPIMIDVVQRSCRVSSLTHLTGFQVGEVKILVPRPLSFIQISVGSDEWSPLSPRLAAVVNLS
jgi:hypothetical protein